MDSACALARVAKSCLRTESSRRSTVAQVRAEVEQLWRREQTFRFRSRDVAQYWIGKHVSGLGKNRDVSGIVIDVVQSGSSTEGGKITVGHYLPELEERSR